MDLLDKQCETDSAVEGIGAMIGGKIVAVAGILSNPIEYLNETLNPNSESRKQRKAEGKD